MTARLRLDAARCTGHGRCYAVAPDLLSDDEEGFVEQRGTDLPVPAPLLGQAAEAESACPEMAITLLGETSESTSPGREP
ncbi:ferredoxin [Streptomyces sp. NPDC021212]|uniref:ferredoxin n=1 Tax=Streptomyces sp. NPDC021212 TaxID=3365118 RepID=UPI00378D653A